MTVDLTTLAADVPLPDDRDHSIYRYVMPEELSPYDPVRFALMEMTIRNMRNELDYLHRVFADLHSRMERPDGTIGGSASGSGSGSFRDGAS